MELMLLRMFQKQILLQSKFVLMASAQVNLGLEQVDFDTTFYGLQNILNAAANISKALWGQAGSLSAERAELRASIGVGEDSPLREVTMRNHYEHFDERLDKWWKQSTAHNHADICIMPRSAILGVAEIDRFRAFDPKTTEMAFWGQDFNVQNLVNEVQRILPKLREEANKPHWQK